MLAAGGIVALAGSPRTGLILVGVCILGAVGTLAAGSWQGARYLAHKMDATLSAPPTCGGGCATCTLPCDH